MDSILYNIESRFRNNNNKKKKFVIKKSLRCTLRHGLQYLHQTEA